MKKVRAKFTCHSVKKYKGWRGAKSEFLFDYEMSAVTHGDENESFFAATPSGSLTLGCVDGDLFEPGKDYFLDFTEASGE